MNRLPDLDRLSPAARSVYETARRTGAVALGFVLLVAALMIANFIQLRINDPLDSPALLELRRQFSEGETGQEMKAQIRALDLLARKAYFTSVSHLRVGSYLLLGGVAVGLVCLLVMQELRKTIPHPDGSAEADNYGWRQALRARWAVSIAGIVLLVAAVTVGWFSRDLLHADLTAVPVDGKEAAPGESEDAGKEEFQPPSRDMILANWPNFRGPDGNGIAYVAQPPVAWDGAANSNVIWKTPLPRQGNSSPVVWGDRVFLTVGDAEARELLCFNRTDGSPIWRVNTAATRMAPPELPDVYAGTGLAAPTAATDGNFVCAIFATGVLIACDMEGRIVWSRFLGVPENHYGHSSSLIIHDGLLLVQLDDSSDPRVLGLDVRTGEQRWKANRNDISWASPICVDTGSRRELIMTDSSAVTSYNPVDGELYWRKACMGGEMGPSPAYANRMVFACNDNAVAVGLTLEDADAAVAWQWYDALPDTASPVSNGECVFLAASYGVTSCVDAENGETLWEKDFGAGNYASPILAAGYVYSLDLDGVTHVYEAGRKYRAVADAPLGEGAMATPAFVGDKIYIRGEKHLFAIGRDR